jgi:hypothetical protein
VTCYHSAFPIIGRLNPGAANQLPKLRRRSWIVTSF